jgi:ABC-type transport system substrate-binding protein
VGRVEINIIAEEQARWLSFDSRQLDYAELGAPASPNVLDGDRLKPRYAQQGIRLYRYTEPGEYFTYFNLKDPVVGGYGKEKVALRRALVMAFNIDDEIRQVWFGQAVRAQSMVPPGVAGFDPTFRRSIPYDPELSAKLLDRFGYKKGADGWRTMPDGSPLVVKINADQRTRDIAKMEIWKRSLDRIGVRTTFPVSNFRDNLKAAYQCELPMWGLGGTASIPDAIDFFQSYYGPNEFQGNFGCYKSKDFDQAYEKALLLPDGPERNALFRHMLRVMEADTVEMPEVWLVRNWLIHPWVKGFKKHPVLHGDWMYLDVDKH